MVRCIPAAEELEELSSARTTINEFISGSHRGHGHAVTNVEKQSKMMEYIWNDR